MNVVIIRSSNNEFVFFELFTFYNLNAINYLFMSYDKPFNLDFV